MQARCRIFSYESSSSRIQEILNSTTSFEEVQTIPARSRLTLSNGFYVKCCALFIDIRNSSHLTDYHSRPVLGKIYRAYLSECVAVMNGDPSCREVFIQGDCVGSIMNTPSVESIESAFFTATRLYSMMEMLNILLMKKGYSPLTCGIGLAHGQALMLKAGCKGSGIHDVIWVGDVVNEACHLCQQGGKASRKRIQVSKSCYDLLAVEHQQKLSPIYRGKSLCHYEGNVEDPTRRFWFN